MPKASLYVCANCSYETVYCNSKTRHERETERCPGAKMARETVTYTIPRLEDATSVETIAQYMLENQKLVEHAEFGERFIDTYGHETTRSIFAIRDTIARAIALFDLTLSENSGKPEFWNWVLTGKGTIIVHEFKDAASYDRHAEEYNVRIFANEMTFRAWKLFEVVFRYRPPPDTESYNNAAFWKWVEDTEVPFSKMGVHYYEHVHEYKPWMEPLKQHIVDNLPKRKALVPLQRSATPGQIVVVDSGPRTLTAWVCMGCQFSSPIKAKTIRHLKSCRDKLEPPNDILGMRVQYHRASDQDGSVKRAREIVKPLLAKAHFMFDMRKKFLCEERTTLATAFLDESDVLAGIRESKGTKLGDAFKKMVARLWGKDAEPRLQSVYTKGDKLYVNMYDHTTKTVRFVPFTKHGAWILHFTGRDIEKMLVSRAAYVDTHIRLMPCYDTGLNWDPAVRVGLMEVEKELIRLRAPEFQTFCNELLTVIPERRD